MPCYLETTGILNKAQEAKNATELASIKEEVGLKWVEVLGEAGPTSTTDELAGNLQDKLRKEDENAVVTYNPANDTFEITYKDVMLEIQNNDTVTSDREEWKDNIEDIFGNLAPDSSLEDKADKIDEELKKEDPNSSATYNPDTGEIDISHGGYTGTVDEDGNVEIKEPIVTQHPSVNITREPSDVSIIDEGRATFNVSAITKGDVTYQWYQNTVSSDTTGIAIEGANSSSYTTDLLNRDSRNIYFYCEITASLNEEIVTKKTRIAKANIFGKVEIAGDENTEKTVLEEEDASFEITASGEGELSYQWYKNSENSSSGGTPISGATDPTYTIEDVTGNDNNTYYYCVVTQKKDGATASVSSNPIKLTVLESLKIVKEPSNTETIVGNEVTFTVEAEGAGELRYEWYRNTNNSTNGGTPIPGANSSTYTIPAEEVTTGLNGSYYYCKITQVYNEQEIKTLNTNAVRINVIEKAGIEVQPTDQGALEGNTAVFDVEVSGEGDITYQWYKNTENSTDNGVPIQGANSASYTTGNLTLEDNNTYYYCVITQNYGGKTETITTDVVKLEVAEKVKVVTNPQSQSSVEGSSVTFESTAVGGGTITYQWYKNTTNSNTGGTLIENATSPNYTIDNTTASMSGTYYYCEITQEYRGQIAVVKTNSAMLTVISRVTITKNPTAVSSIAGKGNVSFSVTASGAGTLSYQWYYKTSSSGVGNLIPGEISSTYTINAEDLSIDLSGRYYYCVVTQKYGAQTQTQTSTSALLTLIQPATITSQPQNITVTEGKEATFSVIVEGAGDLSYQWYKNTENSSSGGELISNATSSNYTIESASADMNETYYYCIVTQKHGIPNEVESVVISNPAMLTIGTKVSVSGPTSVNTIENTKDVTFTVHATGEGMFEYLWYENTENSIDGGTPIDNANSSTYTIPKENVTTDLNNTYYYCTVVQTYGGSTETVNSAIAGLSVIPKASIIGQPESIQVIAGKTEVTYTVNVAGEGNLIYQWYKNTSNSISGGEKIAGAVGNTYTISAEEVTTDLDNTYYYCIITQSHGNATNTLTSSVAELSVISEVNITANPIDQNVIEGNTAVFNVTASGDGELSYQWYSNNNNSNTGGTAIPNANSNTYTIENATTGMNGIYYYCVITQKYGNSTTEVKTDTVLLTVTGQLTITKQPIAQNKLEGNSAEFSVTATGAGDLSYQWYSNKNNSNTGGTKIASATSSTYTTGNTTTEMNGTYYYCVVTQKYGNSTAEVSSNTAMLTVGAKVKVTTNPSAQNIITGNQATFSVSAVGDGDLSYQWYVSDTNNTSGGTAIQSATFSTYTTSATTTDMSGKYYYCVITQNYQGQTTSATSNTALLTVIAKASVTKNPTAVSVIAGKTDASFSITAQGTGDLSYQWYKNTSNSTNGGEIISGANSSTYTLSASNISTDLNNTYYYCVVTQNYEGQIATVSSSAGMLTVVPQVSVKTQPNNVTVTVGNTAEFSVSADGEGELSYQWYTNKTNSNTGGTPIDGATNSTYTTNSVTSAMNETYYYCIITQKFGSPNQGTATVTTIPALLTVGTTVSVSNPSSVSTIAGKTNVSFSVTASGSGDFEYQWYRNSTNSNIGGSPISGATNATYTISVGNVTTSLDNTYYYCVVTQTYGSSTKTATSSPAQLTVKPSVTISTQPTAQSVYENKPTSFTVAVNGDGNITYQWYSNSSNSQSEGSPISGATNATYTIPNATSDLNGKYYYCVITQKYGSPNQATATVTTTPVRLTVITTTITANPTNITLYVGGANGTVTLDGTNAGTFSISSDPNPTYATATISGNTITITPKTAGSTTLKAKESNGNKEVTINITVKSTNILASTTDVIAYVGGASKTVTLSGTNAGTFSISSDPNPTYATATISRNTITITPKTEGTTSLIAKEANGNKEVTINITVKSTSISADTTDVEVYVGGSNRIVTLSGTNAGTFSISSNPNPTYATASISGSRITIVGKSAGTTSLTAKEANGNQEVTINITVKSANYSITSTSNTQYYDYLQEAVSSATTGQTIKVLRDVNETTSAVTISKNLYIDTQNYTVSSSVSGTNFITLTGTLNLIGNGSITTSTNQRLINNTDGTLNINEPVTLGTNYTSSEAVIYNTGKIVMSDGTILDNSNTRGSNESVIKCAKSGMYMNVKAGTLTMTGGRVEQNGSCEIAIDLEASSSYSMGMTNVTANITGGTVVGGISVNGGMSGMWSSKPSLTIGSNSDELSTTNPLILSGENNMAITGSNANFYFYNGKIGGVTEPYSLDTTGTRTGYSLMNGQENIEGVNYKTAYYMGRPAEWENTELTPISDGENGIVPLPEGFYYVGGTKSQGIVISDSPLDEGKGTSHSVAQTLQGNQFVWVPVENDSEFIRYNNYISSSSHNGDFILSDVGLSNKSEPYYSGYANERNDYEEMEKSVLLYNGFYVGRYETGVEGSERDSSSEIEDEAIIKQGKNVYNYIKWSSQQYNDETGGAVEVAKRMYQKENGDSVTSTLIYGVQWDAIMAWIDPAYKTGTCTTSSFVRDSRGRGNFDQDENENPWRGELTTTGSSEDYAIKNIYDLAGNVQEYTMEVTSAGVYDSGRTIRGRTLY